MWVPRVPCTGLVLSVVLAILAIRLGAHGVDLTTNRPPIGRPGYSGCKNTLSWNTSMARRAGINLLLVRGRGRPALRLRLAPGRVVATLAGSLVAVLGLGGIAGLHFHAPGEGVARTYRLLSSGTAAAALYRQDRRIPFEKLPARRAPVLPEIITAPLPDLDKLVFRTPEARRGMLRVRALHLDESISVRPFDAAGHEDPDAFAAIRHLWRCRFSDHEVPVSSSLVRLLVRFNDIYDRPVQLVSGHRTVDTVGTKETSQHTKGTAADIRVAGVSARDLQVLARDLGARGVGLYRHKQFVHVDFRAKRKYFWVWEESGGEREIASAQVGRAHF